MDRGDAIDVFTRESAKLEEEWDRARNSYINARGALSWALPRVEQQRPQREGRAEPLGEKVCGEIDQVRRALGELRRIEDEIAGLLDRLGRS